MLINPQVRLHRLILSLSEALDCANPLIADHQLRVAYMSTRIARLMGFNEQRLRDVFHAAALHDIGLIRPVNRIQAIAFNKLEGVDWHSEVGYELLRDNKLIGGVAPIVRYHHVVWNHVQASEHRADPVPVDSFIIGLADAVDRRIQRDVPILHQMEEIRKSIRKNKGKEFCPDCVDAFLEVSTAPAFWLDATSKRIYALLSREVDWPTLIIDEKAVESIAHIFARLVDAISPWTATHSAGVAATAVSLAERLNFSPREQILMRTAGFLHDIGKVTVPSEILDNPHKPTPQERAILNAHTYHTFRILDSIGGMPQISEWAAFHHERLDGKGYPFGHEAKDLVLGSRIMAVADAFTAITEDRPYRKGMDNEGALKVMTHMKDSGALDGEIVNILHNDFDGIQRTRREAQAEYSIKQKGLIKRINILSKAVAQIA
jgi:putative nucleotidyltransferase with HDIG domain